MASDDSRGTGPGGPAQSEPAGPRTPSHDQALLKRAHGQESWRQEGSGATRPGHRLVLELVISEPEPLSGMVGPADAPHRVAFHGWIDLMSAIHTLCADNPPAPR
jgi:hypothetical protein